MEYIHLGRSGLSVSRICLGTMNFGPLTPATEAEAIMDHAHEIGINFFDTANRYGGAQSPPGALAQHERGAFGLDRGDHRRLVRVRRRTPGAHRARHQAVRGNG